MKYFGFAECNNCKDREGPWVLLDNRFLCEKCYENEKKLLFGSAKKKCASASAKDKGAESYSPRTPTKIK